MGSASFFGYVFVVNNIIPFLRLLLFFIGSYHFSTYKKLMIWCLFLLTSIEMFGIIHVAMCNRACRNKLKHGELSEWSKVQHSKCCVRNVPRVRIPNSPPTEPLKTQCFQGFFLFGENSFVSIFCVSVNFPSRFYALFRP